MAQRISTSFINTNVPGAYFDAKVKSSPLGTAISGNIVIVGEAKGGAAVGGVDSVGGDSLRDNFYTPDQLDRVVSKYISGPIVDAMRALSSPSSDSNITGSVNRVYIAKTNKGTQASAVLATAYGTLKDKNWGTDGNKYNYLVSQSVSEVAPSVESGTIANFGAVLDGASFTMRVDGGTEDVITLGTGSHGDVSALITELNGLMPSGVSVVAGAATDSIKISYDTDASANSKGSSKSIELIDSSAGDLALLSLVEGLITSSAEPEIQVDINRSDTGVNESFIISADVALSMGYVGTTATVTVTDGTLTTTVTGGSGSNLSIDLTQYNTMKDLADYINSQTGYSATAESGSTQLSPVHLDDVTSIGICSTGMELESGRIKKANYNTIVKLGQSTVLDFIPEVGVVGLPDVVSSAIFLGGGTTGSTISADVVNAVSDLETINVNFVVPLFSRNATDDIADGLTDSSSAYTIDAIHALIKSHILKMSTAKIKRHRLGILSYWGTYSETKSKASTLAHARISLTPQRSTQVSSTGNVVNYLPWYTAVIAAGMQAAGFYKSIVNKFANVISFQDPTGFDSGSVGDIEDALDAGLLILEKDVVGNKWVSDQTTYGIDTNFVYNSLQAMYAADLVALDLTASFQTAFTGQSLADVDASTGLSFLDSKMFAYKQQKLISASSDAPLGYTNAKISISGPIMSVGVEIKLTTSIYFIPINIQISEVQSAA